MGTFGPTIAVLGFMNITGSGKSPPPISATWAA